MSDTEIAKELEIARGTVNYHKKKALEKIKNYLKEHENEWLSFTSLFGNLNGGTRRFTSYGPSCEPLQRLQLPHREK